MPYSNVSEVPKHVPANKRKQWMNVWNSSYNKYHDEGKAFAMANAAVKKEVDKPGSAYISKALVPSLWEVDKRQVPQDVAGYDPYGAKNGKGCANCQWFISPNSCILVAGDIEPTGNSNFYTPKITFSTPPLLVKIVEDEDEDAGVEVSFGEKGNLIEKIKGWFTALKGGDKDTFKPFTVFKDDNGNLRYWLIYSNKYIDKHKQIICEEAHKEYVEWVDQTGESAYPELQLWHCGPLSAIGRDDFVDYVDGFAISSGIIYKEYEAIALKLANLDIGVSHGFLGLLPDKKVYTAYRSFERSVLPRDDAANTWTAYAVNSKERVTELAFSDKKKAFLKGLGIPDTRIAQFEAGVADGDAALKALGIEYKEEGEQKPAEQQTPTATAAQIPVDVLQLMAKELDNNRLVVKSLQDSIAALTAKVDAISVPVTKQAEEIAAKTFEAAVVTGLNGSHMASRSNGNLVEGSKEANKDDAWMAGGFAKLIEGQVAQALGAAPVGGS